jgi:hypothetical protein
LFGVAVLSLRIAPVPTPFAARIVQTLVDGGQRMGFASNGGCRKSAAL